MSRRIRRIAALAAAAVLGFSALGILAPHWFRIGGANGVDSPAPAFHAQDVTAEHAGGPFALTDPSGRLRSLEEFRGEVVILTFGYTNCPDFCPTTLSKLAQVHRLLGEQGARLQVIFVSVDPGRDSSTVLGRYVPAFDPSFLGLRGTEDQVDALTASYGARYQIFRYQGQTIVEHTSSSYLIDPTGRLRLIAPYDESASDLAEDVRALLPAR